MLHGCKQNPDDFAIGTGMNEWPKRMSSSWLIPGRRRANVKALLELVSCSCASTPGPRRARDHRRDHGELTMEFGIPAVRMFVAGLSAGGAMAAVMARPIRTSTPRPGSIPGSPTAQRMTSCLHMQPCAVKSPSRNAKLERKGGTGYRVRTIIFHGGSDTTVHPSNATHLVRSRRAMVILESGSIKQRSD